MIYLLDMEISNLIATISLVVSSCALLYTARGVMLAGKAYKISLTQENRKNEKLEVRLQRSYYTQESNFDVLELPIRILNGSELANVITEIRLRGTYREVDGAITTFVMSQKNNSEVNVNNIIKDVIELNSYSSFEGILYFMVPHTIVTNLGFEDIFLCLKGSSGNSITEYVFPPTLKA